MTCANSYCWEQRAAFLCGGGGCYCNLLPLLLANISRGCSKANTLSWPVHRQETTMTATDARPSSKVGNGLAWKTLHGEKNRVKAAGPSRDRTCMVRMSNRPRNSLSETTRSKTVRYMSADVPLYQGNMGAKLGRSSSTSSTRSSCLPPALQPRANP